MNLNTCYNYNIFKVYYLILYLDSCSYYEINDKGGKDSFKYLFI